MSEEEKIVQDDADATLIVPGLKSGADHSSGGTQNDAPQEKSGSATSIHEELFRDEELDTGELDLSSDASADFRRLLELNSRRYQLEKMIAAGGFGEIFLARDRILGRKAVVKSLKKQFLDNDTVVSQFITEAKLCAQLRHPAIIPIYSLDTDSINGLHITMQLLKGITLKTYLKRTLEYLQTRHVSAHSFHKMLWERLELFLRICEAISYCHERRVIHNDLKPDNIMLANFGQVYVMDWGIACKEGSPAAANIQGTISYMAPERIATRISTRQSDVFSLGMILNEIVTLRDHIREPDTEKLISRICTGAFEPSSCILPGYHIPAALRAIIEKARCPNPADRYPDVKTLAEEVRRCLFYEEVKAHPDHWWVKVMRYFFRHKQRAFILLTLVVLGFGGATFYSYHRRNAEVFQLQQAMLGHQNRQTETELIARNIEQRLLLLQEQIRSLGSTFKYEYEHPVPAAGAVPLHPAEELRNARGKMIHTAYYHNPVTLEHGVFYSFGGNLPAETLQRYAECFARLHSQLLSAMFMNAASSRNTIRNDENKLFHLRESLIRRIIFLLGNQAAYCYPGMYDSMKSAADFQSEFVQREFRTGQKLFWSPPFLDTSGSPVTSCWQTLFNSKGKPFGSIGFEISFRELMKPVMEKAAHDPFGSVFAIVDKEDRVLYTSRETTPHLAAKPGAGKAFFYRFPQLLRQIRDPRTAANFTTKINGKNYRIYWTKIPAADWLLLRHIPLDR